MSSCINLSFSHCSTCIWRWLQVNGVQYTSNSSQSALSLVKYVDSVMVPCDIIAIDFCIWKIAGTFFCENWSWRSTQTWWVVLAWIIPSMICASTEWVNQDIIILFHWFQNSNSVEFASWDVLQLFHQWSQWSQFFNCSFNCSIKKLEVIKAIILTQTPITKLGWTTRR